MLGDLEKVGFVILQSGYYITPNCDLENSLYYLNNDHYTKNTDWYSVDGKDRQNFYKENKTLMKVDSLLVIFQKFTNY